MWAEKRQIVCLDETGGVKAFVKQPNRAEELRSQLTEPSGDLSGEIPAAHLPETAGISD